jgi:photosystem II stability/assembly factor-like uncharacterized protein
MQKCKVIRCSIKFGLRLLILFSLPLMMATIGICDMMPSSVPVKAFPSVQALAIDPSAPQTVYVGTSSGLYKSTDGGDQWIAVEDLTGTNISALLIDPESPRTVYAGAAQNGVIKSTDGGKKWTAINKGLPRTAVFALALAPTKPQTVYVTMEFAFAPFSAMTGSPVFQSADDGKTWNAVSWNAVNSNMTGTRVGALAIDPSSPQTMYVGARGFLSYTETPDVFKGGVFKSTDGGNSWIGMNNGLPGTYVLALAIDPTSPQIVYAGTDGVGFLYKSMDGGKKWNAVKMNPKFRFISLAIDPKSPKTMYGGTSGNPDAVLYKSTDGGNKWTPVKINGMPKEFPKSFRP